MTSAAACVAAGSSCATSSVEWQLMLHNTWLLMVQVDLLVGKAESDSAYTVAALLLGGWVENNLLVRLSTPMTGVIVRSTTLMALCRAHRICCRCCLQQ